MKALVLDENNIVINIIEVEDITIFPGLISYVDGISVGDKLVEGNVEHKTVDIPLLKRLKREEINYMRALHNSEFFEYNGHKIACDALSRSDIDGVATNLILTGEFPVGYPGFWKTMDNNYISMNTREEFNAMYGAMTAKGASNFMKAEELKAWTELATTEAQLQAINW